jgi:hypothetical protein
VKKYQIEHLIDLLKAGECSELVKFLLDIGDLAGAERAKISFFNLMVSTCINHLDLSAVDLAVRFSASLHVISKWKNGGSPASEMRPQVYKYLLEFAEKKLASQQGVWLA